MIRQFASMWNALRPSAVAAVLRRRTVRAELGYGAFLSYSGDRDRRLLPRIQQAIEKHPRRWYRPPRLRIFLDYSGVTIGPKLEAQIISGLSRSQWLVVVASPEAAQSKWVGYEIEWWLRHRTADRLLLVLSDGNLAWDKKSGDWDAARSTALPPALLGAFAEEPVWKTVRWRESERGGREPDIDAIAVSIAAVVRGVSEEDLKSEGLRETRRNLRWAQAAGAVLAMLLVIALVVAQIALVQRDNADRQTRIAAARLMASVAEAKAGTDIRAALLLAVAAYRTDPSARNLGAVFRANVASPALVRYATTAAEVTALTSTADGRTVLAGLADGQVVAWSPEALTTSPIMKLAGPVNVLATSPDGSVVAASDGRHVALWRRGAQTTHLDSSDGRAADPPAVTLLAIAPSGKLAAVRRVRDREMIIEIVDIPAGQVIARHPDTNRSVTMVATDDELIAVGENGDARRLRIADGTPTIPEESKWPCGTQRVGDLAANGAAYPCSSPNKGEVSIHPVPSANDSGSAEGQFWISVPLASQSLPPVLSNSGRTAAAPSQDGGFYLVAAERDRPRDTEPIRLAGATVDALGLLRFLGDSESRLISASRNQIILWDTAQVDRLAATTPMEISFGCRGCEPVVSYSPDTRTAIVSGVRAGYGDLDPYATLVHPLRPGGWRPISIPELDGIPVWQPDSGAVAFAWRQARQRNDLRLELPAEATVLAARQLQDRAVAAGVSSSPDKVVTVGHDGVIYFHDARTGQIEEQLPAPGDIRTVDTAAISPDGRLIAFSDTENLIVFDVVTRRTVATIPMTGASGVQFTDAFLLIQRGRDTEIWERDGSVRRRTIGADIPNVPSDLIADRSAETIVIRDPAHHLTVVTGEGTVLGTIPPANTEANSRSAMDLTRDGRYLLTVTTGSDKRPGMLIERDISPEGLIRAACERAGAELSAAEWDALVGIPRPVQGRCPTNR